MKTFKVGAKIRLRKDILDVEGRAILGLLKEQRPFYKDCRAGKYIELSLAARDSKAALSAAEKTAAFLHNPLTETLELEILK